MHQRWNRLAPLDLDGQALTYYILAALRRPADEMVRRAEKSLREHPGEVRFQLLHGYACLYASEQDPQQRGPMLEKAMASLREAARGVPPDAAFVQQLAQLFDSRGMYRESEEYLARAADSMRDVGILRLLAQRLWQNGHYGELIERLRNLDPASSRSDAGLLALRAAALYQLNRPAEARPLVDALGQRDDETARVWVMALRTRYGPGELDARPAVERYQAALTREPNNPIIRLWMGEAYQQMGETEMALQAWRTAGERAPGWAAPHVLIARAMLATGQTRKALAEAQSAYGRQKTLSTAITLALAAHAGLDAQDKTETQAVLELVRQIQRQAPVKTRRFRCTSICWPGRVINRRRWIRFGKSWAGPRRRGRNHCCGWRPSAGGGVWGWTRLCCNASVRLMD